MTTQEQLTKKIYIDYAKFLQNILLENNIRCYLTGGSLINAVRDNGEFKSDDIDFAVLSDEKFDFLEDVLQIFKRSSPLFSYHINVGVLSIFLNTNKTQKIDFFLFRKRHINYYLADLQYIHEKIFHFQTFKTSTVTLENTNFITIHRPDLFLKTVYGNYLIPRSEYSVAERGNTLHMKECNFYTDYENYDKIDFQVENLKLFFNKVNVKRDIINLNPENINIFDDVYKENIIKSENIFYADFIEYMIKNHIDYLKF
jgi:hypothetical protein